MMNELFATPLYDAHALYAIEKAWFDAGHASLGLMQQAAWQMAVWIHTHQTANINQNQHGSTYQTKASVWVGAGNNGGDGWYLANYLAQLGWQIRVIEVATPTTDDAKIAKKTATQAVFTHDNALTVIDIDSIHDGNNGDNQNSQASQSLDFDTLADWQGGGIIIDALFGIDLDRKPIDNYAKAICHINRLKQTAGLASVVAVDIPSGVVASTGQVFAACAVQSDVTLCLIANKLGLHTGDGKGQVGEVVVLPLIPILPKKNSIKAHLLTRSLPLPQRENNSHKGDHGHVLIVGGNQTPHSGMGGAAILAAAGAFAVGVGKVTVACHAAFFGAVIARQPNAMTTDLHQPCQIDAVLPNIDVVAIGMGLGRDNPELFWTYIKAALTHGCALVIDADALYYLATASHKYDDIICQLRCHVKVFYTPHSGEMGRLLNMTAQQIEADRHAALIQAQQKYGGVWLLKGAGSLVTDGNVTYVCNVGNAGMATAGMGDVLSGMTAGTVAGMGAGLRTTKTCSQRPIDSLAQAVLLHGMAGDSLVQQYGQHGLQAQDIPQRVRELGHVLNSQ